MPHTHGQSKTRLYRRWWGMIQRCRTETHPLHVLNYRARDISVCPAWQAFEPFHDWALANGYRDDLCLDRRDNDLGYSPENCRWVTSADQMRNTRRTILLTAFGETKCLLDWSNDPRCSISASSLQRRLQQGHTVEDAITKPALRRRLRKRPRRKLTAWGESKLAAEWSRDPRCKISAETLRARVTNGIHPETAMLLPTGHPSLKATPGGSYPAPPQRAGPRPAGRADTGC
jgi:hypothetical protein